MTNSDHVAQFLKKDEEGLTLKMREVLQELVQEPDVRRACANAEVPYGTVKSWLQKETGFRAAYDNLTRIAIDVIKDAMESTAMKATGMYDEAIDATDIINTEVKCPECDHHFHTEVAQPNWAARLKAGETALKVARVLKDVKETTSVHVSLTMDEMIALARTKADPPLPIPPSMRTRLRAKGAISEIDPSTLLPTR